MPVPPATTSTIGAQRATGAHLARTRRILLARQIADTLAQTTAALVEALGDDPPPAEACRVAANHTSTLLGVLARGAARLGRPLPPETLAVAGALRAWAVTASGGRRAGLVVVLAPPPTPVAARGPGPAASHPAAGQGGDRPKARVSAAPALGSSGT